MISSKDLTLFLVTILTLFLVSCDNMQSDDKMYGDDLSLKASLSLADEAYEDSDYSLAALRYDRIRSSYPDYRHIDKLEAKLSYIYYLIGKYDESIEVSDDYLNVYPSGHHADYVLLVKSASLLKQNRGAVLDYVGVNPSVRDLTRIQQAKRCLQEILASFPYSEYYPVAVAYLNRANNIIANYHYNVSSWYWSSGAYVASTYRLQKLLDTVPDSYLTKTALSGLEANYQKLNLPLWQKDISRLVASLRS